MYIYIYPQSGNALNNIPSDMMSYAHAFQQCLELGKYSSWKEREASLTAQ